MVLTGSGAQSRSKEQGTPRDLSPSARSQSARSQSPGPTDTDGFDSPLRRPGQEKIAIHQGPLSIQHAGRLMKKFFVLYPDRLDYFENAVQAVSGQPPLGRIALSELLGHDIFGCGLILDLLGRKIGLRAD